MNTGNEFTDFKMTFSISVIAYFNKMINVKTAEEALNKRFSNVCKEA